MKQFFFIICVAMHTAVFANQNQAMNQLVYEIRDPKTDAPHFRQALEKIGEYLALEVMEELQVKETTIKTLTGADAQHQLVNETPVLVTILRAGIPLNNGVLKVFPHAEVGFIGMARNEATLKAKIDYVALNDITNRTVILIDTMLATGGSMSDAIKIIQKHNPARIYIVTAIACKQGIAKIQKSWPEIKIFAATVDPILNDKGYIVPGLGDAGDRCYGIKVDKES